MSLKKQKDKLVLNSYAKLNLYLEVLNKRRDGYHNLNTIFERIDLCDRIVLKTRRDKKIKIICKSADLPRDNTQNLAFLSAKLLQDSLKIDKGVDIVMIKHIPVAAGLGGGSSNAAAVLTGLNKLWKVNLAPEKLIGYAQKIGSDVPFFIFNSKFAQGSACGDQIKPLKSLNNVKLWHILVVPRKRVLTARIYQAWDKLKTRLTRPKSNVKILRLALKKRNLALIGKVLFNSLQEVTSRFYPEIGLIKKKLNCLGVKSILMSGSGPAVFGLVSSRKEAAGVEEKLKREGSSWEVFITCTR